MKRLGLLILMVCVAMAVSQPVFADWTSSDGHKMHFPQLPNVIGWDVNATNPVILADDWLCTETGWVEDIHFWGSWRNGIEGEIISFILSIHSDIPASAEVPYSRPGPVLWEREISDFILATPTDPPGSEGWYDPASGEFFVDDHVDYYQYNIFLDSLDWFLQEVGTIYWLNISAIVADPVATHWGWKSTLDHWNDDAVYSAGFSCVAPDNGTGTITYPPDCDLTSPEEKMMIIDGLPPGTTIESEPTFYGFSCNDGTMCATGLPTGVCEGPGGSLGGTGSCFDGSLRLEMKGTGILAGFNRTIVVPMFAEIHHGPRNPGDPVQTFSSVVYRWRGELFGDPDFCTFRVTGGTDYGLPSPGQTELTELSGGLYNVDSFFDITYQIEFVGCPGSILEGFMGTTTATIRMSMGGTADWVDLYEPPDFGQTLDLSFVITGSPLECGVAPDSTSCLDVACPSTGDICVPVCAEFYPPTGQTTIIDCDCIPADVCYVAIPAPDACVVPDNGTGTADLPPVGCQYTSPDERWMIIDGLPPGTTIEMEGILMDFINIVSGPGGTLGGEYEQFEATLDLTVKGTGTLAGFNRHLAVPIECETHSGPRNLGDPIQNFQTVVYEMTGELFGDPDFCTLRVRAGSNLGLPGPGQTVLTELPNGDFAVESFFDVTYQIEFEGCPSSPLDGYMGTTTATIRIQTGITAPPSCAGGCPPGYECVEAVTENPDGTIGVCCECVPLMCEPTPDSTACNIATCAAPGEECLPTCSRMNIGTGDQIMVNCVCQDSVCYVDVSSAGGNPCIASDNGTGTADLPPVGCDYRSPDERWMIIDGLPPGTTIEMEGILMDFFNIVSGPGGSLGGEYEQFDATLDLTVTGTGDLAGFNRHLAVPISCETHSAARNPGDPVQTFSTVLYEMTGELFGDPDFCTLRVYAGNNLGLPSPGQTKLTELPSGDFAVESFFDVTYQIEFEGCPDSPISDYMGTTTATIRILMGPEPPICAGECPPGQGCERTIIDNGDGTIDICCQCVELVCEPNSDSSGCNAATCTPENEECQPTCARLDINTGDITVLECQCQDTTIAVCHVDISPASTDLCVVPDNGSGTADLPPAGCEYASPDETWMIIDGLPPGTTIELDGPLTDFINVVTGPGGTLSGEYGQFEATLDLTVTGTGELAGFNRHIWVPVSGEIHTGPRAYGNPVQQFPTIIYDMTGELFGDPDFCTLRVRAGNDLGLPSPGYTVLRELQGGYYAVESFFDVTYQIEFEGCPASQLEDYSGTTTATIRIKTGTFLPCVGECPQGEACEQIVTVDLNGNIEVCCQCLPIVCEPNYDSSACRISTCTNPEEECLPVCASMDLETGDISVLDCECQDTTLLACHVDMSSGNTDICIAPDNGNGTADLPPVGCDYLNPAEDMLIVDGLPPGTTIELEEIFMDFINIVSGPGGSLGGEYEQFEATLDLTVKGTGELTGFNRHIVVPIECETHSGPRTSGDPVQSFPTVIYEMTGELFGDPDFCTFRVKAGTTFGLPSPGHTTLRELPDGDFAVESFFDVTYQIEFEGCPASIIQDYMGTTTRTIRLQTGAILPVCTDECPPGEMCQEVITYNADGTVDICCQCVPEVCEPTPDGLGCRTETCVNPDDECLPICVEYDPLFDETIVTECVCIDTASCYAVLPEGNVNSCIVSNNGNGSANLPPIGCEYLDPDEDWMIIDGLPPGTTIEMDGILEDFINVVVGSGGSLGGQIEQYEATLDLTVTGTGELAGFNRHLAVPISGEIHSGKRSTGSKVQKFMTDMFELNGQLFGDPDFCELIITAGTNNDLPSPGEATLIELPSGDYAVESFFDVTYQIQFEGCPDSPLSDYMGTTTATIRIHTGSLPSCDGDCLAGEVCEEVVTFNPDGTINICCECAPLVCEPTPDSSTCKPNTCVAIGHECQPTCAKTDLGTGESIISECVCQDPSNCHVVLPPDATAVCNVPDNGNGSADMPPVGCKYHNPTEKWNIIDGLPPGTTIEFDTYFQDFINIVINPGGPLGGYIEQFEATLDMAVTGTGELTGFNRHIAVPLACETHSGPRSPGDSVQEFETDMYQMQGELFGDPDFCTLRVRAGAKYGLSSPGQTTLRELPSGEFAVESFFDVVYQIEFEGCPASQIDGFMGTTTDSIRIFTGLTQPYCEGDCPEDFECRKVLTYNLDGTLDICCECIETACDCEPGNSNGDVTINILDITYLISFLYKGGSAPTPYALCSGDPNCDCTVNILDITYLIAFLYKGGQPPCDCQTWLSNCGPPLR